MTPPSYFPPPPMSPWRYAISTLGPLDEGVVADGSSSPLFHSAPASLSPFSTAHHFYSTQHPFATSMMMQGNANATLSPQSVPPFDNLINSMSALQIQDDSLALEEAPPRQAACTTPSGPYHLDIPTRTRRWGARYVDTATQTDDSSSTTTGILEGPHSASVADSAQVKLPSPPPPIADLICLDSDDRDVQECSTSTMPPSPPASVPVQASNKIENDSKHAHRDALSNSQGDPKPVVDAHIVDLRHHFKFEAVEAAPQQIPIPESVTQERAVIADVPTSYLSAIKSDIFASGDCISAKLAYTGGARQPMPAGRTPQQIQLTDSPKQVTSSDSQKGAATSAQSTEHSHDIKREDSEIEIKRTNVLTAISIAEAFASNAARAKAHLRPQILELGSVHSADSSQSSSSSASGDVADLTKQRLPAHSSSPPPPPPPKDMDISPEGTLHSASSSVEVIVMAQPVADHLSTTHSATPERKEVAKILVDVPKASYNAKEEKRHPASPVAEPAKMSQRVPLQAWPMLLVRPLSKSEDQRLEAIEHLLSALTMTAPNESRYEFSCQMRTIVRLAAAFDVHPCDFGVKGEEAAPLTLGDVKISTTGNDGESTETMHLEVDCSRVKTATANKWVYQSQSGTTSMSDVVTDLVQSLAWRRAIDVVGKADDDIAELTKLAPLSGATTLNARAPPTYQGEIPAVSTNIVLRRAEPLFINESRSSPEIFNQSTRIKFGKRSLPRPFDFGRIVTPATQESIWIALLSAANRASVILEAVFGPEPASLPVTVRMGDVAKRVHEMESRARPALETLSPGQQQQQQQQQHSYNQVKVESKGTKCLSETQQSPSKQKKAAQCTCKVHARNQPWQQKGRAAQTLSTKSQKKKKKKKEGKITDSQPTNSNKTTASKQQQHSSSDYETAPEEEKARKARVKKEGKSGMALPLPLPLDVRAAVPEPVVLPQDIPLPCSDAEQDEHKAEKEEKQKPLMTLRDLEMVDWRAALLS